MEKNSLIKSFELERAFNPSLPLKNLIFPKSIYSPEQNISSQKSSLETLLSLIKSTQKDLFEVKLSDDKNNYNKNQIQSIKNVLISLKNSLEKANKQKLIKKKHLSKKSNIKKEKIQRDIFEIKKINNTNEKDKKLIDLNEDIGENNKDYVNEVNQLKDMNFKIENEIGITDYKIKRNNEKINDIKNYFFLEEENKEIFCNNQKIKILIAENILNKEKNNQKQKLIEEFEKNVEQKTDINYINSRIAKLEKLKNNLEPNKYILTDKIIPKLSTENEITKNSCLVNPLDNEFNNIIDINYDKSNNYNKNNEKKNELILN